MNGYLSPVDSLEKFKLYVIESRCNSEVPPLMVSLAGQFTRGRESQESEDKEHEEMEMSNEH